VTVRRPKATNFPLGSVWLALQEGIATANRNLGTDLHRQWRYGQGWRYKEAIPESAATLTEEIAASRPKVQSAKRASG
jgi:hypothetical protein